MPSLCTLEWGGKFHDFSWYLLGKLTFSPRANAQSLGLTCEYNLGKHIHLMLRFNGYEVRMHRGYKVDYFGAPNPKFAPTTQDRSYVMTSISYDFGDLRLSGRNPTRL
ncbi:hypothetical protein NHP190003_16020 (plasmid) [Helicobacter sp. NHP19-003]|uniref:Uncharacterized protein n=1 Tax=Helicobacter gastrocanis TaxID=2849641 RepID=A0ABM7SEA8_9HELI|nr:outer membrane family protein [Helicobacter sp. NHP19-003]BCZ18320.1 hypothetical protein NHP190003_16020 [Helicobacter sp. NHP19-003]